MTCLVVYVRNCNGNKELFYSLQGKQFERFLIYESLNGSRTFRPSLWFILVHSFTIYYPLDIKFFLCITPVFHFFFCRLWFLGPVHSSSKKENEQTEKEQTKENNMSLEGSSTYRVLYRRRTVCSAFYNCHPTLPMLTTSEIVSVNLLNVSICSQM
jgi:hypothetical protein